ncbi:MAG: hypothetical protein ABJB12_04015 [Pseudomonadota bacterium]
MACSSSSSGDGTAGGSGGSSGDGESSGTGGSGAHAGSAGKAGHTGSTAGDAGAGGTDAAGAAGASGAGGEAGANDPCAACPSDACVPDTGECVDCVASNDHCPDGQYCTAQNTCVPGCKDDSACASGVCMAGHECQSCISDTECSAPRVCGASECAAACTADQEGTSMGCSTGLTCCSTHCVDATSDSEHCGACGTACAAGQFCGIGGCHDSTLASLCSIAKVTVVLDGQDGNAIPARTIAAALTAQCAAPPVVREVSQDVADAVNASSGRPVAGGDELLIAAGGFFFAHLTNYVTTEPVAPIYGVVSEDGLSQEYRKRKNDDLVATELNDGSHDSEDYLLIQIMRDADSGSVILNAQGFWQSGTTAAAYYVANVMLPVLATETKSWYVYKWTDGNANQAPDLGEFMLVDSGT